MRVLLDSNVLVAAFAAHGLCHTVFELCLVEHEIVLSEYILKEVEKALKTRVKLPPESIVETLSFLRRNSLMERPVPVDKKRCRDPKDLPILGLAVAARCDALVSGDADLLAVGSIEKIPIMNPRAFYEFLKRET